MSTPNMPTSDAVAVPTSPRRLPLRVLLPVVLLVVLLGAGGVYTAINLPKQCGVFGATRHGLICEAPLPAGAVYQRDATALGIHGWVFVVASTSYAQLHDFFTKQLPSNGWKCVLDQSDDGTILGTTPVYPTGNVSGAQSSTVLTISFVYGTFGHPSPEASPSALASMQLLYGVEPGPAAAISHC